MPFYEYECRQCGMQTEVLQKISDRPLKKCPACGKSALVRLISAPVFRLKGSGWYETDFKGDQDRKRNLADAGSDAGEKDSAGKEAGAGEAATAPTDTPSTDSKAADAKASDAKAGDAKAGDAKVAAPVKENAVSKGAKTPERKPVVRKAPARKQSARAGTTRSAQKGGRRRRAG